MPILNNRSSGLDPNAAFGKLNQIIDFVAQDKMAEEGRKFKQEQLEEDRQFEREMFREKTGVENERIRKKGNLQAVLSAVGSGQLNDESAQGILSKILTDPDAAFGPQDIQFKESPTATVGPGGQPNLVPGTKIPIDQLPDAKNAIRNEIPLSEAVTKELGLPAGTKVPITEADSYLRAYTASLSEKRASTKAEKSELDSAIDNARLILRSLQAKEYPTSKDQEQINFYTQQLRELSRRQQAQAGVDTPEIRNSLLTAKSRLGDIRTQLKNKQIDMARAKKEIRDIHKTLGGGEFATDIIERAMQEMDMFGNAGVGNNNTSTQ